jgi:hypothetical protein
MKRFEALTVALCCTALLATACDRHSPSEPESRDSLALTSVDPPSGTQLAPGAAVTFTAAVDYRLRSDSLFGGDRGTLVLSVVDQDGRDVDTEVRKRIASGSGSTSLSDRLVVPTRGVSRIRVQVALVPDAAGAPTLISEAATYPVGR